MPDSFVLPNIVPPSSPAGSSTQVELKLANVVHQQQDAIVFEGAQIPQLAGAAESFLIFYLTEQDEQNGFGTVIQLDPSTKQAAIFADLNPEYAYLFFTDEQGQLQTLLWCIEFATRTPDGLYVTQAKVHGRGVSEIDMQRLSQIPVPGATPQAEHPLAEADPLPQPTQAAPLPADAFLDPQPAAPQMMAQPVAPSTPELQLPPLPSAPAAVAPSAPSMAVAPAGQTVVAPTSPAATSSMPSPAPDLLAAEPAPSLMPMPEPQPDWNQPRPAAPSQSNTMTPSAPLEPMNSNTDWNNPGANTAIDTLNLDPLPPLPDLPAQPVQATMPAAAPQLKPLMPQQPAVSQDKQPVGRPPKPLTADQAWMIEPQDFTWLKQISREPLEAHKDELRQKIIKQIRKNRPGLVDDWQFHGAFEQAFLAVAQTYDLVPSLRHDLLKSLLNGKVVDQVVLQQQSQI